MFPKITVCYIHGNLHAEQVFTIRYDQAMIVRVYGVYWNWVKEVVIVVGVAKHFSKTSKLYHTMQFLKHPFLAVFHRLFSAKLE